MALQVQVAFNGRPVGKWALDRPQMRIGRSPENEIQLDLQVVSRHHASFEQRGPNEYAIRDLGTINGTWLNGARIEGVQPVKDGDVIQIGAFTLAVGDNVSSVHQAAPRARSGDSWNAVTRVSNEDRDERERASTMRAYLAFDSSPGLPHVIDKDVYQIGKDATCELRLEGVFAPRKLALIVRGQGGWKLVNVSADGKRVERNGTPVPDQAWLADGDRLLLLDTVVVFHEGSAPEPSAAKPA
ncbi:MAG TPA: FHA domain-containing protein [Planctomycetota bacterium]|nr:FHA domain-containing protein [Planctomycetota bacterium]